MVQDIVHHCIPCCAAKTRCCTFRATTGWSSDSCIVTIDLLLIRSVAQETHCHGHLSNAIDHDDQQAKEGEAGNLLAVIGADWVHMGPQKKGCSTQTQHKDLEGLGLVQDHGALDQRELTRHQRFPALQACRAAETRVDIPCNQTMVDRLFMCQRSRAVPRPCKMEKQDNCQNTEADAHGRACMRKLIHI